MPAPVFVLNSFTIAAVIVIILFLLKSILFFYCLVNFFCFSLSCFCYHFFTLVSFNNSICHLRNNKFNCSDSIIVTWDNVI